MIALLATLAFADIVVESPPVAGQEVTITVVDDVSMPVPQATVRAIHRPGLPGERDLAVGLTDARGRVYWTPSDGGPMLLRARDEEAVVHVDYAQAPTTSLVLLLGSAGLGLGLLLWGLWPARSR